jgi:hypothetical protein
LDEPTSGKKKTVVMFFCGYTFIVVTSLKVQSRKDGGCADLGAEEVNMPLYSNEHQKT